MTRCTAPDTGGWREPRGCLVSLQHKLLLVSVATLLLPVAGWLYLRQMDVVLRQSQQQALIASAGMLARTVRTRAQLPTTPVWHVQRSILPLVVDGYAEDWQHMLAWAAPTPGDGKLSLAEHAGRLYLLLQVADSSNNRLTLDGGSEHADHVDLWLGMRGARCHYRFAAAAPGLVDAVNDNPPDDHCPQTLQGQWQADGSGYQLETELPATALGYLGVRAVDVGAGTPAPTAAWRPLQRYWQGLAEQLATLLPEGERVRLVDKHGWVIAKAGGLVHGEGQDAPGWLSMAAYRHFVAHGMHGSASLDRDTPRLDAVEVWQALSGISATSWRSSVAMGRVTLAATVPLPGAGEPAGAIVLEQSARAMPLLNHRGLLWLLLGSLALLLLAGVLLAGFALRLGRRLRRLHRAVHRAAARPVADLDDTSLPGTTENDELGDLARGHEQLLRAVSGYTGYLRTLASRLSHELNTPLAIVQSSLDNLDQGAVPADQQVYLERAREGSRRLAELVRAMGAATRIEHAVRQAEAEDFNLGLLVAGCAEGYRLLAGKRDFQVDIPDPPPQLHGAPDLVAQALDKLFANALSFTPEDGWIRLSLEATDEGALLELANQGPALPEEDGVGLFDSLVSHRATDGKGTHLGLGLYIARMIALQHQGHISAVNLLDGVCFRLLLKGMPRRPVASIGDDERGTARDD